MPRQRTIYRNEEEAGIAQRAMAAVRTRRIAQLAREVGPLPAIENVERRESCRTNLKLFLTTYFPHLFTHEFSAAHNKLVDDLQNGILHGQSSVAILPRGFGKTTITLCSVIWAALYGHRSYTLLVSASAATAKKLLENIRHELLYNPYLAGPVYADTNAEEYTVHGDFPEVCIPIRRIGGASQRQGGQTVDGELTRIKVGAERLILPTVNGSEASGVIIESCGVTSGIRGRNITTSRGSLRPDMVICDDIQTDKSAKNAARVEEQLSLLNGTLRGLSGVDSPLTMVATLTIIEPDDLAVQLLKSPNWRSSKFGVVDKLPSDEAIAEWAKLNQLQADLVSQGLNDEQVAAKVNAAFNKNKKKLIDGCKPTWDAFRDPTDVHPMQKIMRLYFNDFSTFSREYMNSPEMAVTQDSGQLTIDQLNNKITAYKREQLPLEAEYITCGCDSQTLGIFYTIMAHAADGTAWIIDYGKYPKGRKTLTSQYDNIPLDQAIYAGYKDLMQLILNKKYMRPDGLELQVSKVVMDCSHGPTSYKIQQYIRDSGVSILTPLFGRAATPDRPLFGPKKPGELRGKGWAMPPVRKTKTPDGKTIVMPRSVIVDVNAWKTALRAGLQARQGVTGSISVFSDAAANHKEYFLHLTSEKSSIVSGKYGSIDMFRLIPNRQNHWLDTTVYALAAGSMVKTGVNNGITGRPDVEQQFVRKRVKLSDIQNSRLR